MSGHNQRKTIKSGRMVKKTDLPEESDSDSSVYSELEETEDSSDENESDSDEDESDSDASETSNTSNENGEANPKSKDSNKQNGKGTSGKKPSFSNQITTDKIIFRKSKKMDHYQSLDNAPKSSNQNEMDKTKLEEDDKPDEYVYDSSDEEDLRNTVGNIPLNWYDEYKHLGYDVEGNKIIKPPTDDEIQEFLQKMDDPNYWRTVKDKQTGQKVVLTDEDLNFIQRIQKGFFPTENDMYEPFEDFFTYKVMEHPLKNCPEHKRSFIPSLIERQKVGKLVHAIKMGWLKPRQPKKDDEQTFYMLWNKDAEPLSKRIKNYIAAPKLALPGHEESYNPPPEYLFTKEEEDEWKEKEPEERKINFIPQRYSCLRHVPSYSNFIQERFDRCLDLYLCPRKKKMRANVDPNDLIPKLPKPQDLQPFPTVLSIIYSGHSNMVRCITVEPRGQFFASGSDDETVKIWEVLTGRCLRTFNVGGVVHSIAWCPNDALSLLLVAVQNKVLLINPGVGDKVIIGKTDALMKSVLEQIGEQKVVQWLEADTQELSCGIRIVIQHMKDVQQVIWHAKGDYFASLAPNALSKAVAIHRLSEGQSQMPFQKLKTKVQCIQFHPLRPMFFLATQRFIRVYNLQKQEMSQKLCANCKWISSLAIHPQGDNVIIGSFDSKFNWFDMELSNRPYKLLRHHKKALRQVAFHKRYPLFASASDDGSLIVCHGMVYSDLLQNPLIVPLKILKGHKPTNNLNILDCSFHPIQPWIFSSGSDSTIRLFT